MLLHHPHSTMDLGLQRVGAAILMAGSVLFLIAAFSPISRVFGERSPERRLEIILGAPAQWTFSQILFGLGAVVAATGILLIAQYVRGSGGGVAGFASAGLLLAGSVLWLRHLYLRTIDPSMFTDGLLPVWLFVGYSLLTMLGIALFGWALLQTPLQNWVGWMLIGSMAFLFVVALLMGDMPPFVHYLLLIAAGVAIYRAGPLVAS